MAAPATVVPGARVTVVVSGLVPAEQCTLSLTPLRRRDGRPGRTTRLPCGRTDAAGRVVLRFPFPLRPPGRPLYRPGQRVGIEVATVSPAGGGAVAVGKVVRIR